MPCFPKMSLRCWFVFWFSLCSIKKSTHRHTHTSPWLRQKCCCISSITFIKLYHRLHVCEMTRGFLSRGRPDVWRAYQWGLTFHSWTGANHVNTVDLHAHVSGWIPLKAGTPAPVWHAIDFNEHKSETIKPLKVITDVNKMPFSSPHFLSPFFL